MTAPRDLPTETPRNLPTETPRNLPSTTGSLPAAGAPRILIVCTGNICRSPLAEQLLRQNLTAAGIDAIVTSAGTRAMTGSAMTPEAAALSSQYGALRTHHVARQLTEKLIADADLVLTATRDHRRDVVTLLPKATRYTFTLNQFARLVAADPAQHPLVEIVGAAPGLPLPTSTTRPPLDFAAYVAEVASTRGLHPSPNPPTLDDVDDPYRQSAAVYARAAGAINASVTTITAALVAAGA
ncbi:arsenate reductase/protein-tyrosine-phosphatase family protein [Cryobacterium aureum]|uniref:arsenate reductase/protein-tyrosine-phosphatase family protein n=1 Tax=Cryobacterium aureum TaxID=995037 RepID=UPI000CF47FED|nr:low molecular weight phosphatase family protein [Cryobacterium aureum]